MTDVCIDQDKGYYDISFDENGDIATEEAFNTGILLTAFEEQRASADEITQSKLRRGWLGNINTLDEGLEIGSKFWLYEQERNLFGSTLVDLRGDLQNAYQVWELKTLANKINVNSIQIRQGVPNINIDITADGSTNNIFFPLWQNTGEFK